MRRLFLQPVTRVHATRDDWSEIGPRVDVTRRVLAHAHDAIREPWRADRPFASGMPTIRVRDGTLQCAGRQRSAYESSACLEEGDFISAPDAGDDAMFRVSFGDELGLDDVERTAFGAWIGWHEPGEPRVGRCVRRDAPDAPPRGFTVVPRHARDRVLVLGECARGFGPLIDVVTQGRRAIIVHRDRCGVRLPELTDGEAWGRGGNATRSVFLPRFLIRTSDRFYVEERFDPSLLAHILVPVAESLLQLSQRGFHPRAGFEHNIHVAFDGCVVFDALAEDAFDVETFLARLHERPWQPLTPRTARDVAGELALLALCGVLSPRERMRADLIPTPNVWSPHVPDAVFAVLRHAVGRLGSGDDVVDLASVVDALHEWQRAVPPVTAQALRDHIAGRFPERVAAELKTRETLQLLDEEQLAKWGQE